MFVAITNSAFLIAFTSNLSKNWFQESLELKLLFVVGFDVSYSICSKLRAFSKALFLLLNFLKIACSYFHLVFNCYNHTTKTTIDIR